MAHYALILIYTLSWPCLLSVKFSRTHRTWLHTHIVLSHRTVYIKNTMYSRNKIIIGLGPIIEFPDLCWDQGKICQNIASFFKTNMNKSFPTTKNTVSSLTFQETKLVSSVWDLLRFTLYFSYLYHVCCSLLDNVLQGPIWFRVRF